MELGFVGGICLNGCSMCNDVSYIGYCKYLKVWVSHTVNDMILSHSAAIASILFCLWLLVLMQIGLWKSMGWKPTMTNHLL